MPTSIQTDTLSTNTQHEPAPTTARAVLDALQRNLSVLGELAVRYNVETRPHRPGERLTISSPEDVQRLVQPEMAHLVQEQLRVLLVNTKHEVVGQRVVYQGNVSSAIVRAAEVFRPAVIEAVPNIILCHNHPSASAEPSPDDITVTKKLAEAGKLLDIELLDHVVIGSAPRSA